MERRWLRSIEGWRLVEPHPVVGRQNVTAREKMGEIGAGLGEGYHLNLPLAWGATWREYEHAMDRAVTRILEYGAEALVVSLGLDTFEHDPISRFKLRHEDYLAMGELIELRGHHPLAEAFRAMPRDAAWTQPQPLLVQHPLRLPKQHLGQRLATQRPGAPPEPVAPPVPGLGTH